MKQLELEQFLKYTSLSGLKVSPNKNKMSFVNTSLRLKQNDYNHELFISNGTKHRKVLNLKQDARYYWENNTEILYFSEKTKIDKKLKEQRNTIVYRFNTETKKSQLAFTLPLPITSMKVLSRTAILVCASLSEAEHVYFGASHLRKEFIDKDTANKNYEVIETVPFQSNGSGFTRNRASQAFVYVDEKFTPLGTPDEDLGGFVLSEDKSKLYYTVSKTLDVPNFNSDVRVMDMDTLEYKDLSTDSELSISKLIILGNDVYFLGSDRKSFGINQNPDFYSLKSKKVTKVLDFGLSAGNSVGSDVRFGSSSMNGTHEGIYYFVGTNKVNTVVYAFDGKNLTEYRRFESSVDGYAFFNDAFYTIEVKDTHIHELYKDGEAVSTFNRSALLDFYVAEPIHHAYKNDGVSLDGWVLLPNKYDETKSYPSILVIHGGPKTIYANAFYHEMQVWANEGYVVYFTNPRGGDAHDDGFADIRGKYGSIDYDDLMAFTDLVEKEYSLDKDRMGVTGGSYGGFMTNWIVSHTDRFKAAATQRSISNWISFYGTSDIGVYFGPDQTGADPLNDIEKSWDQSPLKYADNIKTPLLFIHSDADYRCPIEQAMQLYTRVKMNGLDTRFVWFKGENHDLSRSGKPQARVRRLKEITEWMNNHLK